MEYNLNGKGIMAPMEYVLMVYSHNRKGMILRKIVFRSGNCHSKRKKMQYKRFAISIKISHDYIKWTKIVLPVVFEEF